jgi:hypothetical protein
VGERPLVAVVAKEKIKSEESRRHARVWCLGIQDNRGIRDNRSD